MNTSEADLRDRRYILQTRDGDYVAKVESTGMETTKLFFEFTWDNTIAEIFSYSDLLSPLSTQPIGTEFVRGFQGGKVVRVR